MAAGKRPKQFNSAFAGLKHRAPAPKPAARAVSQKRTAPVSTPAAVDDAALFAAAMRDAMPLAETPRRQAAPVRRTPRIQLDDDAYALAELCAIVDGSSDFRTHASEEEFYGAAAGVNNALLDGLRRGQYATQQCLDLHGMDRHEAHQQVIRFVTQARCRDGATCVLIVTGRGRRSPDGTSVLRETLPRWLSRAPVRPHVLAYATARPVDGGPGAYYVLLRRAGVPPFGQPA